MNSNLHNLMLSKAQPKAGPRAIMFDMTQGGQDAVLIDVRKETPREAVKMCSRAMELLKPGGVLVGTCEENRITKERLQSIAASWEHVSVPIPGDKNGSRFYVLFAIKK